VSTRPFWPLHATAADLLLWDRRPGDIDRLLHCRRGGGQQQPWRTAANAGTATLSADVGS